ncbi:exonuclease domain-containing protein, partial [Klebsiella pneumoniae]|nr:exonuclease domain-containing protein [Klebsiella pneumoniae]
MTDKNDALTLKKRFRGYFPVVIDVETAGFNAQTDALLEICAVTLSM